MSHRFRTCRYTDQEHTLLRFQFHPEHRHPFFRYNPDSPTRKPSHGNGSLYLQCSYLQCWSMYWAETSLKIAYYRKKAGYTQEVFAEMIGKSLNFLGQVEGPGTVRGISLETLFKIADVLGIPPSKLLEDD